MKHTFRPSNGALLALVLALIVPLVQATDINAVKLFGKWAKTPMTYGFGTRLAISEKWLVVGAESSGDLAAGQGSVHVFNAATGAFVRKIAPVMPQMQMAGFGCSCAIAGDLLLVGTRTGDGPGGSVRVYSMASGALLRILQPAIPEPGAGFGASIAVAGDKAVIGAPQAQNNEGRAYVFDYVKGVQLGVLALPGAMSNDVFGMAVAASGNLALIGAPWADSIRGLTALFDLRTNTLMQVFQPSGLAAGDGSGNQVALHDHRAIIAASGSNGGAVFVIDLLTGGQKKLQPADVMIGDYFGESLSAEGGMLVVGSGGMKTAFLFDLSDPSIAELARTKAPDATSGYAAAVALCQGRLAVSAILDPTQASAAGAVYLLQPVLKSMPMIKVLARGSFAPGAADIQFNQWGDVSMNNQGEIAFAAALRGAGSNNGRDTGGWDTLAAGGVMDLLAKSRLPFPGFGRFSAVQQAITGHPSSAVLRCGILADSGTPRLVHGILYDDGNAATLLLNTNGKSSGLPMGSSAIPRDMPVLTHSRSGLAGVFCHFKMGVEGVTSSNDSGIFLISKSQEDGVQEGNPLVNAGETFGQIAPRMAFYDKLAVFSAAVNGSSTVGRAVFAKQYNTAPVMMASDEQAPPSHNPMSLLTGAKFSAFIGETADDTDTALFRATLAGPGVTPADNEGLWRWTAASKKMIFRKGQDLGVNVAGFNGVPALKGVTIGRFARFWQTYNQSIALVQLKGAGVTPANDMALLLFQTSGVTDTLQVLIREGDAAPGCGQAVIGSITGIEVAPYYGHYLVLATLKGASPASNLGLFRGFSHAAVTAATQSLRKPVLILRKGDRFDNQPSPVKSFSLSRLNGTPSGAGATGLGGCVQESNGAQVKSALALTVDFANGVRQLMMGTL